MKNEQIEKDLRAWFVLMTNKYSWLKIKFEFSNDRGVWLVSFAPVDRIEVSDEFNLDAMVFANEMNEKYGTDAPLFTDEEELFSLSSFAETFGKQRILIVETSAPLTGFVFSEDSWCSVPGYATAKVNGNCHPTDSDYKYALAA